MGSPTSFAIIPAAGHSRRMGRPKLLIRLGTTTLLEQTVRAWRASRVQTLVLVARRTDARLIELARPLPVELVLPEVDPPDMRTSIQRAIGYLARRHHPAPGDVWLAAPADMVGLRPEVIDRLLDAYRPDEPAVLVPRHATGRGHPILLPWAWAGEVAHIPRERGLNHLLDRHPVVEVPCRDYPLSVDVDTPEDLKRVEG